MHVGTGPECAAHSFRLGCLRKVLVVEDNGKEWKRGFDMDLIWIGWIWMDLAFLAVTKIGHTIAALLRSQERDGKGGLKTLLGTDPNPSDAGRTCPATAVSGRSVSRRRSTRQAHGIAMRRTWIFFRILCPSHPFGPMV